MTGRRVAVTGLGAVTPTGIGVAAFWDSLVAGRSGVGPITLFDVSKFSVRFGAEVKGFEPENWFERTTARRFDRFAQFFVASAEMAIKDCGIDFSKVDLDRTGCISGNGVGGLSTMEESHGTLVERGPDRLTPFMVPRMMSNASCGEVAIRYHLRGPNFSTASACAASAHAIGLAFRAVKYGEADIMITGGSEAALTPLGLGGFAKMKALSPRNDAPERASRPFDKGRDGFVLGEGGAALVLEDLERAKQRGARIYALIEGVGMTDDGHHITAPDPEGRGATRAMILAMVEARASADEIDYINAHGTSTEFNDRVETVAIKQALGEQSKRVLVSATKSMIGHLLGGAGAAGAVATVLALHHGVVPPTVNYEVPDPECDLDYVPKTAREARCRAALVNAFGFGGHNGCLLFRRYLGD